MKEGGRNKSGGVVEGVEQVSAGRVNDSQDVSNSLTRKSTTTRLMTMERTALTRLEV